MSYAVFILIFEFSLAILDLSENNIQVPQESIKLNTAKMKVS